MFCAHFNVSLFMLLTNGSRMNALIVRTYCTLVLGFCAYVKRLAATDDIHNMRKVTKVPQLWLI